MRTHPENLMIGGVMPVGSASESFAALVPQLDEGPTAQEVDAVLTSLSDVEIDAQCAALSVGLRATTELQDVP